jgi:hypothetical protein
MTRGDSSFSVMKTAGTIPRSGGCCAYLIQGLVSGTAWDGRCKTTCSLVSTPALSTLILLIEVLVLTSDWIDFA